MHLRTFRIRFRRRWRKQQHQVEDISQQAEEQIERHFLGRLNKFGSVWRLVTTFVLLFVLIIGCLVAQIEALSGTYQTLQPIPGGIYTEGVTGSFTNANPIYATSEVDTTVSKLLFAGLLSYDTHNRLVGDLAESWSVDKKGMVYTVHLRPHLTWQDGQPLTAADVVFTYQAIQNPDAESPLQNSWQGITVAATDARTVTFSLPNPLSSFPYNLTTGIVPQHLLGSVPMAELRSANFNTTKPIGAGPFEWETLAVSGTGPDNAEEQVSLVPFENYWAGAPKLKTFNVHAFATRSAMVKAYRQQKITAMVGLDKVPTDIAKDDDTHQYDLPLTAATMVFFKTTSGVLKDATVRQALVQAANVPAIIAGLGYPTKPVNEPILLGQLGYNPAYAQVTNHPAEARAALDKAGWKVGQDGQRSKQGVPLAFDLFAASNTEYAHVTEELHKQWAAIGVNARVHLQQPDDFQNTLSSHSYDAVLYGIAIGVDPDVFVYWDSSQADIRSANRLNLSEYQSDTADEALEAGRTRLGDRLRTVKYQPFLKVWQQDAPALGLYQPRLLYLSHTQVFGLDENPINSDAGRLRNVQNWMIRTGDVTND